MSIPKTRNRTRRPPRMGRRLGLPEDSSQPIRSFRQSGVAIEHISRPRPDIATDETACVPVSLERVGRHHQHAPSRAVAEHQPFPRARRPGRLAPPGPFCSLSVNAAHPVLTVGSPMPAALRVSPAGPSAPPT